MVHHAQANTKMRLVHNYLIIASLLFREQKHRTMPEGLSGIHSTLHTHSVLTATHTALPAASNINTDV